MAYELITGDCLAVMPTMEPNSVDAIVTDPPYGLGFMGKDWDHGVPGVQFWREALRVAKPGAHLLAFGGTRTFHRLAVAIEDAGWEIRDTIMWVYGSGFPKSHDVSKAIDKAAGAVRTVVGEYTYPDGKPRNTAEHSTKRNGKYHDIKTDGSPNDRSISAPATPDAARWQGWGTALKPAWEPIIVARKPLQGTVAQNVLTWGTGAINVDGCRVEGEPWAKDHPPRDGYRYVNSDFRMRTMLHKEMSPAGRWPANLIHDGSDEVLAGFPVTTSGDLTGQPRTENKVYGSAANTLGTPRFYNGDTGSAARFFYCAKASKADRDDGCEGMDERDASVGDRRPSGSMSQRIHADEGRPDTTARNHHPTVKPTALMCYLVRLVTPPGGVVLDPFMGSGSTGKAATLEGFRFIGIDTNPEYVEIARRRIAAVELPLLTTNGGGA